MFLLRNVRLTFLDFDSVIKNSVQVKTGAFPQFSPDGVRGHMAPPRQGVQAVDTKDLKRAESLKQAL